MEFITNPLFYLAAVPAILIVGASKSGFGGGLGIVGVPLMALVVSPQVAAAVMLPILCVMDIANVWIYRRAWDKRSLAVLLPAAMIGLGIGALLFNRLDPASIKLILAVLAIGFPLDHWLRRGRAGRRPPGVALGGALGTVAGVTSFVAHAGGPPVAIYLLPRRLEKSLFVGTTVMFFTAVNYAKLLPYYWLGQFQGANLGTAALLLPVAGLGIWAGLWAHRRLDQVLFYRLTHTMLFLTGLKLLYDGLVS